MHPRSEDATGHGGAAEGGDRPRPPGAREGGRRVLLFGKLPEAGRAKTRLAPELGHEGAARLYRGFLDDAAEVVRGLEAEGRELWVERRPGAERRLARRYPFLEVRLQPEGDLGRRMRAAFGAAFRAGAERAVLFGSDHPTLPPGHLEEALAALERVDVSVGPTADGGYYAVAMARRAWPEAEAIFEGIGWSTAAVLEETLERAGALGLSLHEAPRWYDVDEPGDLPRLRRDVRPGSATHRALEELGELAG